MIELRDVYDEPARLSLLWELLKERDPSVNVSHSKMPSWEDHVKFVESRPYPFWLFVCRGQKVFGAAYLTTRNEIGIFIFKAHHGHGYGPQAVRALMEMCGKRKYIANINPENTRSTYMFHKLGFKWKQSTYALET